MNKKIKVLLFDNDGVLAHTEELFFEINTKCFKEICIPYTRADFENHTFITNLGTRGFMKGLGCTDKQIERFRAKRTLLWQEAVTETNMIDQNAEAVLSELKKDYKIGIVTNTNQENFNKTHHDSNIPALVDFIVTREDYEKGKPEPDSYVKALEVAGCTAEEAIVIEDSPRGIKAAKAANIVTVVIPNLVIKNLDVSQADYRVELLSELPEFIKSLS